jgi:hypothetical protein
MAMDDMPINNLLAQLDVELTIAQQQKLKEELAGYINELLQHNFHHLVYLLYRIDVSERRLKSLLKESTETDAALIIADLMIQRQIEKRKSRDSYQNKAEQDDEEKW